MAPVSILVKMITDGAPDASFTFMWKSQILADIMFQQKPLLETQLSLKEDSLKSL